jgi:pimeloyl-ACP methyl ester carboxylesterase
MVLFGPIARRAPCRYETLPSGPAWRIITLADQWARFVEDVPPHATPPMSRAHFDEWGRHYLESDSESSRYDQVGVKIPTGPLTDILHAWHGALPYEPALVKAPVAIIRGAWDGVVPDPDAKWLFDAFANSGGTRDIKISRGTHLMHLETMRHSLFLESIAFLLADGDGSQEQAGD